MKRIIVLVATAVLLTCGSPAADPARDDPNRAAAARAAPSTAHTAGGATTKAPIKAPGVSVTITEWTVPWEDTRPRDPYVGPQGRVWFVGQRGDYLAYLDEETGEFTRFDLAPGTGPHNLVVDDAGQVWYAGNRAAHIGRLDPETGEIVKYPMPDPEASDPHTLVFDRSGDIWFTVQRGGFVGKLNTDSGAIRLVRVPTRSARPYGIVVDSNNRPWIAEFGSNKLATVDPATMELEEIELPRPESRPRRLAVASDDSIWYLDYALGFLGRLDPATGEIQEWALPGGRDALAYGMAMDHRDRPWFVETGPQPNLLVGFAPERGEFIGTTEIESGGGTVRHMYFDEEERNIWFGTDHNTIGRASIP